MMGNDELPEKLEIRHEKSDEYRLVHADGVHGGAQPQGIFKLDFTFDHNPRVISEYYEIKEDDIFELSDTQVEEYGIREHRVGVTMTKEDVFDAASWILAELIGPDVTQDDVIETLSDEFSERIE